MGHLLESAQIAGIGIDHRCFHLVGFYIGPSKSEGPHIRCSIGPPYRYRHRTVIGYLLSAIKKLHP